MPAIVFVKTKRLWWREAAKTAVRQPLAKGACSMSYERWFKENEFDTVLFRVREYLMNEPTVKPQNFIISPIFDENMEEILAWHVV